MENETDAIKLKSVEILDKWLETCTRHGKLSRNTVAVGMVVLDHLRSNKCPVIRDEVISSGGEVKGARSGLGNLLAKYGIPKNYLKEVTTRQAHQDGQRLFENYKWGEVFCHLDVNDRDSQLLLLIGSLASKALERLKRQNLKLDIDRRQAPTTWIQMIIENAKTRSGGVVEQHLVGAKLERRFQERDIANYPAHAADVQTSREGDFTVANNIYHITASPGRSVIQKCAKNIMSGKQPILLVPSDQELKAKALAQDEGVDKELMIVSIESFVAVNIVELATDNDKDYFGVLQEIVEIYNRRLSQVETDLSLQIEVR